MFSFKYFLLILIFLLTPLLISGIVKKTRARAQGRKGPPLLQPYYDFVRTYFKVPIDNPNSNFFSEIAPYTAILAMSCAWTIVVFEWTSFIALLFLIALYRISITSFAMETGTSFGGLGTSREILLSVSAEPVIVLLVLLAGSNIQIASSLKGILLGVLFLGASFVVVLAEIAKPPFDDPRTHLELTMVHEAMLLEASGRSLALFELASTLKISTFFALIIRIIFDHSKSYLSGYISIIEDIALLIGCMILAALLGFWESISVRRKWSWNVELIGMIFLFMLVLGTMVKLS